MLKLPGARVLFFVMIGLMLALNIFVLHAQQDETYQQTQDSLLNTVANLNNIFEKENGVDVGYFPDNGYNHELRFNQIPSIGVPRSYMDLIRNPEYEFYGYQLSFKDTVVVDPMFMPVVFTGKILPDNFMKYKPYRPYKLYQPLNAQESYNIFDRSLGLELETEPLFEKEVYLKELKRKAYLHFVDEYPMLVKYKVADLPTEVEKPEQLEVNVFRDLFKVENNPDFEKLDGPERLAPERKYWFFNGNNKLQFSQNYISDNWYKGGTGNLNVMSIQSFTLNYKKEKINFNNLLEWTLGLYTNPSDDNKGHKTKIGTDLLRTYSELGIQAFNNKWFYSSNLEMKTQLLNNYNDDTNTKVAAFMSPFLVNMGILGMKYELNKTYKSNKHKKLKVNFDLSPLSVKYTYVGNDDVDPTRYGIPAGKNSLTQLGSTLNSIFSMDFSRNISLKSRFKYFTNYEKNEIESENELNMALNRYFSTRIYLYLRYDDSDNIEKGKYGYLQINELLSFGFSYRW